MEKTNVNDAHTLTLYPLLLTHCSLTCFIRIMRRPCYTSNSKTCTAIFTLFLWWLRT